MTSRPGSRYGRAIRGISVVTFAVAFALMGAREAVAALPFAPCGQPDGIVCGTVTVPLDRTGSVPGTVHVFVEKKPTAAAPPQGAVFALTGGPGFAGTAVTQGYATRLAPALQTRDLIVMDYRGVGLSDPLSCVADWTTQRQQCALELGPRVHFYSTREIVEDIEAVRQQLGVDKIGIYAVSYGTLIAQAYARRYGNHIEFLVLDSVLPTDGWDPFVRTTFQAIPRVLNDLCAGGQCRGITADPVGDLVALLARMGKDYTVSFVDVDGRPYRTRFDALSLFNIYYGDAPMFQAATRARLPSAVASALRGDTFPLGRLFRQSAYQIDLPGSQGSHGPTTWNPVAYSVTKCEDMPVPWRGETTREGKLAKVDAAVSALPASLFAPFPRAIVPATPNVLTCLDWIVADRQPVVQRLVPYTGRALVIAGEQDLRTPLENAQAALAELPGAVLLPVHAIGHAPSAGSTKCTMTALADFFAGRSVQQCAPAVSPTPPEPIAPTSLVRLKPWPGVPGTVGKTIRAVVETVRDVGYTAYTDGPFVGLRFGTFSVQASETHHVATMRSIQYVPGIVVSGTFDDGALTARVTVTGAGSRGSLTITAKAITGKLGGKKIRAAGASLAIRGPDNR